MARSMSHIQKKMRSALPGALMMIILLMTTSVSVTAEDPEEPPHHWHSHSAVAKKVIEVFEKMNTYRAHFDINTTSGKSHKSMSGTVYYQKPGRVRFDFSRPGGDFILSDGNILWIYIRRLSTVGKQDLKLKVKNENGQNVFLSNPEEGLSRLFRKYHYRFDTVEQPRVEDGQEYFVLDLEQREKIGGYEKIKLFVDTESYLIKKAIAWDGDGKETSIRFRSITTDTQLEGKLFQYKPDDRVRVVMNPLVSD